MYRDGLIEIMQSSQVLLNLNSVHDIKGRIRLRWKVMKEDGGDEEEEKEEKEEKGKKNVVVVLDGR